MKSHFKIVVSITVVLLLTTFVYILLTQPEEDIKSEEILDILDTIPPNIYMITGNMTGMAGEPTIISVNFSDNINVTSALLFYKPASALHWSSKSILTGHAELTLPQFSTESWYYYLIIDDAAGNGPIGDPSIDGTTYYTINVLPTIQDNPNEDLNDEEQNDDQNISRSVFVEVGTKIVCSECPKVSLIIQELYESGKYPFYYVSLPIDNPNAAEYLSQYNIWGYPTVFIDGGYEIVIGSSVDKALFEEKITLAADRIKPELRVSTQAQWINNTQQIHLDIDIQNHEATLYSGQLRVYLTEIISKKWQGGTPEHYSFLSFLINEPFQVISNGNQNFTLTVAASDLDPENLMIFSVISNAESHIKYSQPPDKNEFYAHYVDLVSATAVIQDGNLPPEIGIQNPSVKYFHRFGNPVRKSISGKTILLGKTHIVAYANDDSAVSKVEFFINDNLMQTVFSQPYEWVWHSFSLGKKRITVIAYDDMGKSSSASIDVLVFIKWPGFLARINI